MLAAGRASCPAQDLSAFQMVKCFYFCFQTDFEEGVLHVKLRKKKWELV